MHTETLGPYEIRREWGRTAFGRVLLARDPQTGSDVDVQLVETLQGLGDAERAAASDRLSRDCGRIAGLKHPNLVAVLDVGERDGVPYVVSEHVEGTPFAVWCRPDSLLPVAAVLDLVAGAARGLDELHRAGVVHGNVEPGSLLRVDGSGMVAGVGLGHCVQPVEGAELPGVPHYLAPERIRSQPVDGRADLFSLGAVLYEMLTGRKAFAGRSVPTILYRVVNEDVRDPAQADPPVHAAVARIVTRALAKRPEDRFDRGADLAEALEAAAVEACVDESIAPEPAGVPDEDAGPHEHEPSGEPPPAAAPPPRMSLRPFVLGACLLVLVAAVVLWALLGDGGTGEPDTVEWLAARVRTEPPGLALALDGEPIEPGEDGTIRFPAQEPFGVLTASLACRTVERRLDPSLAGGEVVLVVDPVATEVPVDPSLDGARVLLNGEHAGTTPTEVALDLCRDNTLEVRAEGYRTAVLEIPSGATPLEARTLAYELALEAIPKGRLVLPAVAGVQLVYYVNGKRIGRSVRELELEEGEHRLRYKNEYHWLDVTLPVQVAAGETTTPGVNPRFATLAVQAFPSNCKVFLRRSGGQWRYLDETPAERRVAIGRYEVKVQLIPTGESRVTTVQLTEGRNPPVRVSFGGGR